MTCNLPILPTTEAHVLTEEGTQCVVAEIPEWAIPQVGNTDIFRYAASYARTAAGSVFLGSFVQETLGTWQGPTGAHELSWPPLVPDFDAPEGQEFPIVLDVGDMVPLPIGVSAVAVDFGNVPVVVRPRAAALLSKLPWAPLAEVLSAVRAWAASAPLRGVTVSAVSDPDDKVWEEVVFEAAVEADSEEALRLWDSLASAIDQVKAGFTDDGRRLFDRHVGIHLVWDL